MADTLTSHYGWTKPAPGTSPTTWGTKVNSDLDAIDGQVFANAAAASSAAAAALPLAGGTMTGALAPSQTAGLTGTTTNNNANAGAVGEYLTAVNSVDTAISNGVQINVVSLPLTPGDWDVEGSGAITFSDHGTYITSSVTLTSLQNPSIPLSGSYQLAADQIFYVMAPTGSLRVSIAAPVPVYLVLYAEFSTGTCTGVGVIRARRVR